MVTQQRISAARADTERETLRRLVQSATGTAIIATGQSGRIVLFNPGAEAMLGYVAEEVIGHTVDEALRTHEAMRAMLTSKGEDPGDEEIIGDGVAFAGVARYPARVKCALLGWMAFTDALNRTGIDLTDTDLTGTDLSPESRGETP